MSTKKVYLLKDMGVKGKHKERGEVVEIKEEEAKYLIGRKRACDPKDAEELDPEYGKKKDAKK